MTQTTQNGANPPVEHGVIDPALTGQLAQFVPALIDSIPYPVIVRDFDHRVLLANRAALEFFGRELLDGRCYAVCRGRDSPCPDCPVSETMRMRREVVRETFDPVKREHLEIRSFPMFDAENRFCGVIETTQVVTESRRNLQRIRELLGQVTQQNKELLSWRREVDLQLELARDIQNNLLPQQPLCFRNLCCDFRYLPCGQVGGDLYDIEILDDGHAGILIADASGHGVSAALIAVMIKVIFNSANHNRIDPAMTLESMNRQLGEFIPMGQFVTAFYGVYEMEANRLVYARAGHPLPILLRAESGEMETLDASGFPLGALGDVRFDVGEVTFRQDDRLLLYTDGVVEAADPSQKRLGEARLKELFARTRGIPSEKVLDSLIEEVRTFTQGRPLADDLTLVLLENARHPYFGLPPAKEERMDPVERTAD